MHKKINYEFFDDEKMRRVSETSHKVFKFIVIKSSLSNQGMLDFTNRKWDDLTEIYICSKLSTNLKMGSIGCKYLSRTPLPCIQILTLSGNHMESSGICHLSKTAWNTLTKISLTDKSIGPECLHMLARANWKSITEINLQGSISGEEIKKMVVSEDKNLGLITMSRQHRCLQQWEKTKALQHFEHLKNLFQLKNIEINFYR